jgi:hypothetical protein
MISFKNSMDEHESTSEPDLETQEAYADFEAARKRPLEEHVNNCFIKTYRPVMDDGPGFRSWETTAEYRKWCEENLPEWLGYGPAKLSPSNLDRQPAKRTLSVSESILIVLQ